MKKIKEAQEKSQDKQSKMQAAKGKVYQWKKPQHIRSMQIRIYPGIEMKVLMKKWIGYCRKIYNEVIAWSKVNKEKPTQAKLREVIGEKIKGDWKYMTDDLLYDNTIDETIKEAIKNIDKSKKDTKKSFEEGKNKVHECKFKTLKTTIQSFIIRVQNITDGFKIKRKQIPIPFVKEMLKEKRNWPNKEGKLEMDGRIIWNKKLDQWFVVWNYKKGELGDDIQVIDNTPLRSVFIDPGIRTFITCFSPSSGICVDIGNQDACRLYRLSRHLDKLIAKTSTIKKKWQKRNYKRAQEVIRQKIKNLVNELHRKTIIWLTDNFDLIVIPEFNVQSIVSKTRGFRRLRKKSVRQCYSMSHYLFRQRLVAKCQEKGILYDHPTEEYTSKQVSFNLKINLLTIE